MQQNEITHIHSQSISPVRPDPWGVLVAHIHREKKSSSSFRANASHRLVVSVQFNEDLLQGRGRDRAEHLCRRWRVLPAWSGPGPALVELDEEERVFEGPPVDDGLHQVDEGHDH